jgi:hypothetical protein
MNPRVSYIFLVTLLIFSQLFAVLVVTNGLAWCHHPDGDVVVETAKEQADCHAAKSGDVMFKSCVDVPIGSSEPSQPSRSEFSRELAALKAALLVSILLPGFECDSHLLGSKLALLQHADDDVPSRDHVLASLSTVIILT